MRQHQNFLFLGIVMFFSITFSSCSKQLLVSTGATDNKPLLFNNEYKTKELKSIEVTGSAFWGIPSFEKNNKNNHKHGMLYTFNGVNFSKTKRIFPILTLVGYSILSQQLTQKIFGEKKTNNNQYDPYDDSYFGKKNYKLSFFPSFLIGLPLAGFMNNITWGNAAFSGASETFYHRLISENQDVDVFFYPKYEVNRKHIFSDGGVVNLKYLWFQDADLKGTVSGATLIHK